MEYNGDYITLMDLISFVFQLKLITEEQHEQLLKDDRYFTAFYKYVSGDK